ncbi:NAD(P)-binding protein [Annulohypoxylon truncatum]|uniref:NAD(P)-binding protein n=1 Tax=Annulohypoxylon truncatum TaxID=327061 RepID=UPI002007603D|nr:NAD(P)-binding protein [Annulohypoxylon truncatum]KAI1209137.1 NAD(P)-binding protein [Annulohypoxylon truncatum]
MPAFDATTTSEQVIKAFGQHAKARTFVITGASQPSIGSSMATTLARASPEHIVIVSRTPAKVEPVLAAIREGNPSVKATYVQADLSDHDSVRRAAGEVLQATASKIDVLINSAGNMALKEYTVDKQGIEMQLSANHVGHFLLTNLLVPALLAAADANKEYGSRVVNLCSLGYLISPFRFDDYNFSGGKTYDSWTGYGQAKTANILFSFGLTKRLKKHGVTSFAAHPGSNLDTQLGSHLTMDDYNSILEITKRNTGKDFVFDEPRFKSYAQIGATPLTAALDPEIAVKAPALLINSQITETAEHASNAEFVEKLWALSEKLVGQEFKY